MFVPGSDEGSFWGIFWDLISKVDFLKKVLSLIFRILIYCCNGSSSASNYMFFGIKSSGSDYN